MEAILQRHMIFSPVIMHLPPLPKLFRQNPVLQGLVYIGKLLRTAVLNQLIFATAISAEPLGGMSFQKEAAAHVLLNAILSLLDGGKNHSNPKDLETGGTQEFIHHKKLSSLVRSHASSRDVTYHFGELALGGTKAGY